MVESHMSKIEDELNNYYLHSIDEETRSKHIVKFSSGTSSALYINGQLDTWGDEKEVQERLEEIFNVHSIETDDFMLGGEELPSPTLDDIQEYQQDRIDALTKAKALVEEATKLLDS